MGRRKERVVARYMLCGLGDLSKTGEVITADLQMRGHTVRLWKADQTWAGRAGRGARAQQCSEARSWVELKKLDGKGRGARGDSTGAQGVSVSRSSVRKTEEPRVQSDGIPRGVSERGRV